MSPTQTRKKKEARESLTLWISGGTLLVSVIVGGFSIWWSIHQKRSVDEELGSIKASLRLLTATVAPQLQQAINENLKAALSEAPLQQPSVILSKIQDDTSKLRKLKAQLPQQQVNETAESLQHVVNRNPESIAAWGAAAEMVSYRSELRRTPPERPDCFTTQKPQKDSPAGPLNYHDCTLNLNDEEHFSQIAPKIGQHTAKGWTYGTIQPVLTLTNGTVKYSGGRVIRIEALKCLNCSFDFRPPEATPPLPGRSLTTQLLVANLDDVRVNLENSGM